MNAAREHARNARHQARLTGSLATVVGGGFAAKVYGFVEVDGAYRSVYAPAYTTALRVCTLANFTRREIVDGMRAVRNVLPHKLP